MYKYGQYWSETMLELALTFLTNTDSHQVQSLARKMFKLQVAHIATQTTWVSA